MLGSNSVVQVSLFVLSTAITLYTDSSRRFERAQYSEARESWASKTGDLAGKNAISTYGAEHFCRLLGKLYPLFPILHSTNPTFHPPSRSLSPIPYHPTQLPTNQRKPNLTAKKQFLSQNSSPKQIWTHNPSHVSAKSCPS